MDEARLRALIPLNDTDHKEAELDVSMPFNGLTPFLQDKILVTCFTLKGVNAL